MDESPKATKRRGAAGDRATMNALDDADGIKPAKQRSKRPLPEADLLANRKRYAVVYGAELIFDMHLLVYMKPSALRLAIGAEAYKIWFADLSKRVITPDKIVFDPTNTCGDDCVNTFKGIALEPREGDCADLLALIMHLVSESADDDAGRAAVLNYVLDWMAYPLQFPGTKLASALVFHGPQGTGKNLFWEAYARIFGEYSTIIGQAQLESRYNDWASCKLFVIGDEISTPSDQTHQKNALKSLVTSPTNQIEKKFEPVRPEKNSLNLVFLSNDNKPLALERDDRRYLVIYCPPKLTDGLYQRVWDSLADGAVEALYATLLSRDLSAFSPHKAPPMTRAKADLVELGLRPAERFAREWLGKEIDLPVHPCSTAQLYRAFREHCRVNGEKNPTPQPYFSTAVAKYARDRLTTKKASPSPHEGGSTITLWLPAHTGPVEGVRWYDYAQECVAMFEAPLWRYCGTPRGGDQ